jgi:hypothetical protein
LLDKAKDLCLVARALSVPQRFEAQIRVNELATV